MRGRSDGEGLWHLVIVAPVSPEKPGLSSAAREMTKLSLASQPDTQASQEATLCHLGEDASTLPLSVRLSHTPSESQTFELCGTPPPPIAHTTPRSLFLIM